MALLRHLQFLQAQLNPLKIYQKQTWLSVIDKDFEAISGISFTSLGV